MKKILALMIISLAFTASACAQNTATDETSKDMATLRKKIVQMKREMDLLIKDIVSATPATGEAIMGTFGSDVYVDILQTEKSVIVKADLPGMSKDKITITLDNNRYLKIAGAREIVKSEQASGVVRQERFSGSFSKVIELPCEVMSTGINATYKDGVLEVAIPKKVRSPQEEVKINIK